MACGVVTLLQNIMDSVHFTACHKVLNQHDVTRVIRVFIKKKINKKKT